MKNIDKRGIVDCNNTPFIIIPIVFFIIGLLIGGIAFYSEVKDLKSQLSECQEKLECVNNLNKTTAWFSNDLNENRYEILEYNCRLEFLKRTLYECYNSPRGMAQNCEVIK